MIVDETLLIEVKSVEQILPVHKAQALTYLNLSDLPQALLINFNQTRLVDGVRSFLRGQRRAEVVDQSESEAAV